VAIAHKTLSQNEPESGFAAQRDLASVHSKHSGIASRGGEASRDGVAGHKAHFHQPLGIRVRQIQLFENSGLTWIQFSKIPGCSFSIGRSFFDTHLHFRPQLF
jgi:hypothetical protein